ncbi:hypothetical protein HMPREF1548_03782 [Clostridium sp. KLE 1755]|nr:hypothetical protein HMPREF1548_03782 [Clostridium sp. KLE 1755]
MSLYKFCVCKVSIKKSPSAVPSCYKYMQRKGMNMTKKTGMEAG